MNVSGGFGQRVYGGSGKSNSFISGTTDRSKSLISVILRADKCVIVFGSYGVGKSSLISRYILDYFPNEDDKNNLTDQKLRKFINYNKQKVELEVRDTNTFDHYFLLVPQKHAYNVDGYVLIYSIDNRASYEILAELREKLYDLNGRHLPQILIGNKQDNQSKRKVKTSEGKALADYWGIPFLEISVKEDDLKDIQQIFEILVEEIQEEEFPSKWNKYKLRKTSPSKRQIYLRFYMILNFSNFILSFILFLLGIYLFLIVQDFNHSRQIILYLFVLISGLISSISSAFSFLSSKQLKEKYLLISIILSIVSLSIQAVCMALLKFSAGSDGYEPEDQYLILFSILPIFIISIIQLSLSPIVFKIIKLQLQYRNLSEKLQKENTKF